MLWNWQHRRWPHFTYDEVPLRAFENQFLQQSGVFIGSLNCLSALEKKQFSVDLMGDEAYNTSGIEGEILNRDSLRSSIARHLGLATAPGKIPAAESGIASMMLDLVHHYSKSLSQKQLFSWHLMLMSSQWRTRVGAYRMHTEAMQVVSGTPRRLKVHYEAPPSALVPKAMRDFIRWFNDTSPQGKNPLPAITRAAIAHLYFVSIHPFEDGNGRIARAIALKSLMQSLNQPSFIALSHVISLHKKEYYTQLQKTNHGLVISDWVQYFAKTVLEAQRYTQRMVLFLIEKMRLLVRLRDQLNDRQEKVLLRVFKEGLEGF